MLDQTTSLEKRDRSLAVLLGMSNSKLLEIFRTLDAPDLEDVTGTYSGHLPHEIEQGWKQFAADTGAGEWLGKTFLNETGKQHPRRGHNRYREDGDIKNRVRFDFTIGVSEFDDRSSILIFYGPYPNWAGKQDLIDELRVYAPGVLLGLYHTKTPVPGFSPREGDGRSAPEFFVLVKLTDGPAE